MKASLKKDENPLRIGILSAAAINYTALIDPIQTHPGVVLSAIAARERSRAEAQIQKYGVGSDCKAYGSYADLLADSNIDAVYIPLPNGLHCEWAIKSMEAGKHVLIEKPIASNANEARQIREAAERTDRVALEAFHWRFHPAAHRAKEIIGSRKYGHPTSIYARLNVPAGAFVKDDIRLNYSLGGGASMDLTYVLCASSYFASPDITKCKFDVLKTKPRLSSTDNNIDEAMESTFVIEQEGAPPVTCHTQCDLIMPHFLGYIPRLDKLSPIVTIELEKARIEFNNFVVPTYTHSITITEKDDKGHLTSQKQTEKCYVDGPQWGTRGEDWWTTYRYQLEAFSNMVRAKEAGKEYQGPWMDLRESEKVMELIDAVYDKAGLPRRGV